MFLFLIACTVEQAAEVAPVNCEEGAALLADVCGAAGVEVDVDSGIADCEARSSEWQSCWLDCVFDERTAGCDPDMLACSDGCSAG